MSPPRCRFCPTTIKRSEINIHGEISIGPDRFIYPPGRGSRPREQDSERRSLAKLSTVRETDSRPRGKDSLGIADRTRQCLRERVRQRPSVPQPVSPLLWKAIRSREHALGGGRASLHRQSAYVISLTRNSKATRREAYVRTS